MNYSKISLFDIANGNGIRVTLFVSGCQFHCPQCFNRETWDYTHGSPYTSKTEEIILARIENENFQGISLLGGDPLWQNAEDIAELIQLCDKTHALHKDVWIWSGFTWEELISHPDYRLNLIEHCDVFIDGRFEKDKRDLSLPWRGSSNQRIIDVQQSLKAQKLIPYQCKDI